MDTDWIGRSDYSNLEHGRVLARACQQGAKSRAGAISAVRWSFAYISRSNTPRDQVMWVECVFDTLRAESIMTSL
jgi:hypothetical protein